ncbi:MAG: manganese efflux pump MntP family protein [Candidatus Aminicenantes bacterium]|jgi:putative Mn2+ efflux pump MntP
MNTAVVLSIALALAMDAFTVSVGISLRTEQVGIRQAMRLSFSFGFFQFLMPILGWLAGTTILPLIQSFDHWVAFGLLFLIGGRMIYSALRPNPVLQNGHNDPTRGWSLLLLSIATSVDALAVGLSFAALGTTIWYPSVIIGVVAFFMTLLGTRLGPIIGKIIGKRAELFGGLILILIGIKILADHL